MCFKKADQNRRTFTMYFGLFSYYYSSVVVFLLVLDLLIFHERAFRIVSNLVCEFAIMLFVLLAGTKGKLKDYNCMKFISLDVSRLSQVFYPVWGFRLEFSRAWVSFTDSSFTWFWLWLLTMDSVYCCFWLMTLDVWLVDFCFLLNLFLLNLAVLQRRRPASTPNAVYTRHWLSALPIE